MKKHFNLAQIIIGIILLLASLLIYGFKLHDIISVPRPDLIPWCTGIFGCFFIVSGTCELFFKKTKEMEIEEQDERNIALANAAKATGFEVMSVLFSATIMVMALLGYLSEIVFFTFFIAFFVSQVCFVTKLWYLQKNM